MAILGNEGGVTGESVLRVNGYAFWVLLAATALLSLRDGRQA